jgi:urease subunit beta
VSAYPEGADPIRDEPVIPGEVLTVDGEIVLNAARETTTVTAENTGDRPIQVGSHYHFAATNPALSFDRSAAWGYRLDIPAGTSVRFEPGISRTLTLVALGGHRLVPGLRAEWAGALDTDDAKGPTG